MCLFEQVAGALGGRERGMRKQAHESHALGPSGLPSKSPIRTRKAFANAMPAMVAAECTRSRASRSRFPFA